MLRLCTNLSYLSYSFSRFILISMYKERNIFKKFTSINLKVYFLLTLLISCVLSTFKLFEYDLNVEKDVRKDFPYEIRNEIYCQYEVNAAQCRLFNAFKMINSFLNDVLFLILNITVDIFLVKNFNSHLRKKSHLKNDEIIDLDSHKDIKLKKKNLNRMIVINGLVYTMSHVPEFISSVLLVVYGNKIAVFCFEKLSCDLINEEAAFFGLISIVFQFVIFYIFDKNFYGSYLDIKARVFHDVSALIIGHDKDDTKALSSVNLGSQAIELNNLRKLIGNGVID